MLSSFLGILDLQKTFLATFDYKNELYDTKTAQRSWQQHRQSITNGIHGPKFGDQLQFQERKPPIVSRQCVVYQFKCDLCDTDYIGYTTCHLHQRIEEINCRASATGAHGKGCHGISIPEPLKQFSVLKKCQGKLDCLIPKMLFIHERKLKLNTQCAHTNSLADIKTTT